MLRQSLSHQHTHRAGSVLTSEGSIQDVRGFKGREKKPGEMEKRLEKVKKWGSGGYSNCAGQRKIFPVLRSMHSRIRVQLYEAIGTLCTAEQGPAVRCYRNLLEFSSKETASQPASSDTCWQNTDSSSVSVCCWPPQPEPGPQRTQHPHLFWPLHGHMSSRRNLNYVHSTQYPETILFNTPLSILLIKKSKNSHFLRIIKQCFKRKSFFPRPGWLFSGWSCKHCWQIFLNASNIFSLSTSLMYKIWQPGSYRPPASLSPWQQWKTIHDPVPWSPVSMQLICPKPLSLMEE